MGYRSDIYLKTTKEGYKALDEYIKRRSELGYELWNTPDAIYVERDCIIVEWTYLKWYMEYEDVRTIDNAIDELSDKYPIHFIRIGEDIEDIDDRWYYPDDYDGDFEPLELVRTVYTSGDKVKKEELFNE